MRARVGDARAHVPDACMVSLRDPTSSWPEVRKMELCVCVRHVIHVTYKSICFLSRDTLQQELLMTTGFDSDTLLRI